MLFRVCSALILVVVVSCDTKLSENYPQVRSPAGPFRGKVLTSFSGEEYAAFRGIPYALPPTGERRFAKPRPYPKIEGIHDAREFGPACVQVKGHRLKGQEDCLYLNVYTPLRHEGTEKADEELDKVFVYIHGGAFVLGSTNDYLPGDFVTRADVVVVTMNYRLGWLGFMRGNSDSLPGNQAFWDQLLALQWVKDNIRAFGGDPDDVTLGGVSAGSISSSILSITPLAKTLFTKAILMSGIGFSFPTPPHSSNDMIKRAALQLGCPVDPNNESIDEVISCLRNLPAEALSIQFDFSIFNAFTSSGDELLPRPIPQLLKEDEYLSEVGFFARDYLVSLTKDDGYVIAFGSFGQADLSTKEAAAAFVSGFLNLPVGDSLVTEYSKLYDDLERSVIALCTDATFVLPKIQFVDTFMKHGQRGASSEKHAYLLSFDNSPRFVPNSYMPHGLDVAYIFDVEPDLFLRDFYPLEIGEFNDEDWQLKSDFIDLVKTFMDSGTPGEKFTGNFSVEESTRQYISFSQQPFVGQDILGKRRQIWEDMLPKWLNDFKEQTESKQEL